MDKFLKSITESLASIASSLVIIATAMNKGANCTTSLDCGTPTPESADQNTTEKPAAAGKGKDKEPTAAEKKKAEAAAEKKKKAEAKKAADALAKFKKTIVDIAKASELPGHIAILKGAIASFGGDDVTYELSDEIPVDQRDAFVESLTATFEEAKASAPATEEI